MSEKQNEQAPLRTAAEAELAHAPKLKPRPAEELLHELQVHQIKLGLQNEELRRAQVELEKYRDRYVDSYDFALVGYLTLNHDGMIDEINPTGATLLGVERNKLPHRRFAPFVVTEDRDRWHRHFLNVLKRDDTLTCELALLRGDGFRFYARLDCLCLSKAAETPVVRIVLTDITERKQAEEALRQSAEQLDMALSAANKGMWDLDVGTGQLYFSTHWGRLFGYKPEETPKHIEEWKALIHPNDKDRVLQELNEHLQGRAPYYKSEYRIRSRSGAWVWILGHGSVISRDHHNNPLRVTGTTQNIAERKQTEVELRIASAAFESQESLMITDADGVILRVNRAFTETTGYTAEEAVGQTPRLLKSGRHDADFYREMWGTLQRTGKWQGEIWDRRKNGEIYPKLLTISAVKGDDGVVTHYVGADHDITKRKAAEEEINNLAFYDSLTQLPNRRLLNDRLGKTMAASKRSGRYGAVMFLDLDNFKPLNDTHGHSVGDLLLIEVAHRLTSCVREVDTVARFGGDEFVVVLSELDEDKAESASQASIVAEKIRASLDEPYVLKFQHDEKAETTVEHHCTSSIGVVLFINHGASTEDILKWADMAMYQAKEAGRNQIRFYDSKG